MSVGRPVSVNLSAYPALRIAILFSSGIVLGHEFRLDVPTEWIGIALTVAVCTYLILSRTRTAFVRMYIIPLLYLFILTGFGLFHLQKQTQSNPPDEHLLALFDDDDLTFYGMVTSARTTISGSLLFTVRIDSAHIHGLPTWLQSFKTEAFIREDLIETIIPNGESHTLSKGTYIHFHGDLQQPQKRRNPNEFDYAGFLARQDIYSIIYITDISYFETSRPATFWIHRQATFTEAVTNLFSHKNSDLAKAIILGDRSGLDPHLRSSFSRAGLAHLMAVSGMHVGFILIPLWMILPWFRQSQTSRFTGLISSGLLLLFYAGITGFSVSVSRASLMAFFMIFARIFHKAGSSVNILGLVAFILLIIDPVMLFDVGFQLSFIAVSIILTSLPAVRFLLPTAYRYTKTGALFQLVIVSVLVQGGLYPLLIYHFNEFSIAGPLSNTLAIPFVQLMFLWTFICLILAVLDPGIALLLNTPGDYILTGLTSYVLWIGSSTFSWIEGTLTSNWIFAIWICGLALFASLRLPALRWKMACALIACLLAFQVDRMFPKWHRPLLQVTFFDVGQGDAVLLQTPAGFHYLYDTGVWTPRSDSADRILLPEFKAMGIHKLDGVILSHPHADHIGGMVSLMDHIPIDTIYQSPYGHETNLYHQYMKRAYQKNIPVRMLSTGDRIDTDPLMPMLVLAPSNEISATDPNNRSVVLMVIFGDTRLILSGDAEREAETFMVKTFGDLLQANLLKIGHHASRTSSTTDYLNRVRPEKGVASLAWSNRYNHPHQSTIRRLKESGVSTRFTSLEGAVIYKSDGRMYKYVPWKQNVLEENFRKRP
ncbi:MAG: DNA internalization-related competence protein ComEC/Rec2 [Balneolales bacterium]